MSKRVRMTKAMQLQICTKRQQRPEMSLKELVEWAKEEFSLPKPPVKTTVMNALAAHMHLKSMSADCLTRKQRHSQRQLNIDSRIVELIVLSEHSNVAIFGRVIIRFAKKFSAELSAPSGRRVLFTRAGWLRYFVARYGFRFKRAHGEIGSVDFDEAAKSVEALRGVSGQYHPANVFNMDETAFFYKFMPRCSYVLNAAPALKQDKSRVTVVVCTNANGTEKLPLLFVGKSANPRWISRKPHGVNYCGTSKGWMTVLVFQKWLRDLDKEMKDAGRRILLLLDSAPVHIEPEDPLNNVCVLKLPPNTTAAIQPMDQGVIASLKRGVMDLKIDAAVERLLDDFEDPNSVSLVDAIEWCRDSWDNVSPKTIQNCWKHAGLFVDRLQMDVFLVAQNN
jgi:hypothetical protein